MQPEHETSALDGGPFSRRPASAELLEIATLTTDMIGGCFLLSLWAVPAAARQNISFNVSLSALAREARDTDTMNHATPHRGTTFQVTAQELGWLPTVGHRKARGGGATCAPVTRSWPNRRQAMLMNLADATSQLKGLGVLAVCHTYLRCATQARSTL